MNFKIIKSNYNKGLWTEQMVHLAVGRVLTAAEYEEIIGQPFDKPIIGNKTTVEDLGEVVDTMLGE